MIVYIVTTGCGFVAGAKMTSKQVKQENDQVQSNTRTLLGSAISWSHVKKSFQHPCKHITSKFGLSGLGPKVKNLQMQINHKCSNILSTGIACFHSFLKIVSKLHFGVFLEPQLRIALHGISC